MNIECIDVLPFDTAQEEEIVCVLATEVEEKDKVENSVDLQRFSSLRKTRHTAYVANFIKRLAERMIKIKGRNLQLSSVSQFDTYPHITAKDIELAEKMIFMHENKGISLKELQTRNNTFLYIKNNKQIIRCAPRLENAHLPYDARNPIYLPVHSEPLRLMLTDIYKNNAHSQQRFWLSRPPRHARRILNQCSLVAEHKVPRLASLPSDRVRRVRPFKHTGCDLLGTYTMSGMRRPTCAYTHVSLHEQSILSLLRTCQIPHL
ncbi:unnamed protein product [Haemonchus placei]|uniref:Transcription initiation factor TFIID subunit 8 n=1 Tax=Haemonchus placei TaxID=6290 RepID=A0A0N4W9E0_HAEPC|nr:unnamed protein product [Haemonchus placei]